MRHMGESLAVDAAGRDRQVRECGIRQGRIIYLGGDGVLLGQVPLTDGHVNGLSYPHGEVQATTG